VDGQGIFLDDDVSPGGSAEAVVTKLRDLERRLEAEPENLGLRVAVAVALREAGRHADAVELYRAVAIAYREQGRRPQALAACRSLLEIAPEDARGRALLAILDGDREAAPLHPAPLAAAPGTAPLPRVGIGAPPAGERAGRKLPLPPAEPEPPGRRSWSEDTPLPPALPHHVADPTGRIARISETELPLSEGALTRPGGTGGAFPEVSGIAAAARRISAQLIASRSGHDEDLSIELDTRQLPAIDPAELDKIPPPTGPVRRVGLSDAVPGSRDEGEDTGGGEAGAGVDVDADEEDQTRPRELPAGLHRQPSPGGPPGGAAEAAAPSPLSFAFFSPVPAERRAQVLARFSRRSVPAGTVVLRRGDPASWFVLVASGRLEIRIEHGEGAAGAIGPGEYIGEGPLLARTPVRANVVAVTEAELLLLAPRDFYDIAGTFPALWAELKAAAERRAREHDARR
jgi:hypothetical protein